MLNSKNPFTPDNDPITNINGTRIWTPGRFDRPSNEEFVEILNQLDILDAFTGMNADSMLLISPRGNQELKAKLADCTRRWLELQVHSLATRGRIDDMGIPLFTDPYPRMKARLEMNLAVAYGTIAASRKTPDTSPFWLETARLFGLAEERFRELGSRVDQAELHFREGQVNYERAAQMFLMGEQGFEHFAKKAEEYFKRSLEVESAFSEFGMFGFYLARALLAKEMEITPRTFQIFKQRAGNSLIRHALMQFEEAAKTANGGFVPFPSKTVENEIEGFLEGEIENLDSQTKEPLPPVAPPRVYPSWALNIHRAVHSSLQS
jgi:hypothetical protein